MNEIKASNKQTMQLLRVLQEYLL